MKKRLLSILLTLCMALSLLPAVAFAEGGAKAIQSGTGSIHGYDTSAGGYSYIYYGTWRNSPIKWRVLDTKANTGAADALFLLTDECLYPLPGDLYACYIQFNPADKPDRHLWKDSTLQGWFKSTFYSGENSAFTSAERALIPATTQASSVFSYKAPGAPSWDPGMRFQICGLEAEHVFAPSIQDVVNAAYGFTDSASRIAGPSNSLGPGTRYWLRSFEISEQLPFMVGENASLMGDYGDNPSAVRPAMNLSTAGNNILFVSAAEGGKPAGGLAEIPEYTGNEWKLTLLDSSRSGFAVTTTDLSAYTRGGTVKIGYTGAKTGTNEYVSAMILDAAGNPAYYGRSSAALTDENGTAELTIPALAEGTYTLKVFNEQYNGDKMTDLASAFADVTLTVEEGVEEQFTLTPGGRYYFDLSAMNIPGTANSNLPDKTLHYVPFTYVGTVDAYSMENETDTAKQPYEHSLFIADYNVKCSLQRETLAEMNLIYGQTYTASNVNYTLRAPSVGDHHRNEGEGSGLAPIDNEWDTIYQKSADYIKNWYKMRSFGQDIGTVNVEGMYLSRGGDFAAQARFWARPTLPERDTGFRPVLELPTDLAADSLKVVELFTKGRMPGETYNRINIIVKKGESFKAPSAEGLPRPDGISADAPLWWEDENGNYYKPGDTVPADVSSLIAFYGGFGLFLDRGDGAVEVTPDNYTDIFGDGTASFVLPKGKSFSTLRDSVNLTGKDILEIYSTGRLEKYGCVFPNLKLKNADLTSVRLSEEYIGHENPLFVTLDGKNTVGSLNGIIESDNTLCVIGDGSLTLNGALTLGRYTQFGGGSVTMTDGLTAYYLTVDSGSLTVTGDPQAITLANQALGDLQMGDGVRLFLGSSAQDAAEAAVPQLSAEMQEVYQRYLAEDSTLTYEELAALYNALRERFNAIFRQLPGKTYVRITGAWDVTYQPGTDGSGNAVTDIKFYNDALTLRGALFTRTGYTQIGWATVDGGEKVYGLDAVYTQNEALTLYPVWNANQYTITFDTDGGTDVASITQAYGTPIIAPANPTKPGCTFTGWNPELPAAMPAENLTVTAQWSPDIYAITYNLDGGTASGNPDFYTVESSTITLNPPTRTGYTFIGWSGTDLSGSDNLTVTIPAGSIGNRSYIAHWSLNTYSITYDLDGGTALGNPDFYTVESSAITLNEPTKAGYVFTGWSGTDLVGEDNLTVTIPAGSIGDRRYTAHWEFDPTIIAALNPTPNVDFLDVSRTDWFYYDVRYVCENGLMNGTSRNRFSPYGTATRGMLVTILYRMENEPRCFGSAAFSDVKPGAYYEKAVVWASQNNIVGGYTDGTFRPDAPVTREQLASILYRYTLYRGQDVSAGETTSLTGYGDAQAVSSYALPAMRWACGTGILQGANGKLNPSGLATRAQLAAMLHRYLTK